eukprot:TRINITY_DN626_c0_g1_i3.p2 TRINITY_DN626_c0_g1~~TRINITY_DN626_c0_g1_i3.p2  ORF type:complete len:74 (+),score=7.94 TRINITY_DN626_c0_g1_i3:492-713(+)
MGNVKIIDAARAILAKLIAVSSEGKFFQNIILCHVIKTQVSRRGKCNTQYESSADGNLTHNPPVSNCSVFSRS